MHWFGTLRLVSGLWIMVVLFCSVAHGDLTQELITAINHNDFPKIRRAVERGADVNGRSEQIPALEYASFLGHLDIVKFLLDKGADVNGKDSNGADGVDARYLKRSLCGCKAPIGQGGLT